MLETVTRRFADRRAAGRELAERLSSLALEDPVVLGLARGGVPVAYEVARALGAPMDVLVVRKIGAPGNPELGIGAIAEGGVRVLNQDVLATCWSASRSWRPPSHGRAPSSRRASSATGETARRSRSRAARRSWSTTGWRPAGRPAPRCGRSGPAGPVG